MTATRRASKGTERYLCQRMTEIWGMYRMNYSILRFTKIGGCSIFDFLCILQGAVLKIHRFSKFTRNIAIFKFQLLKTQYELSTFPYFHAWYMCLEATKKVWEKSNVNFSRKHTHYFCTLLELFGRARTPIYRHVRQHCTHFCFNHCFIHLTRFL